MADDEYREIMDRIPDEPTPEDVIQASRDQLADKIRSADSALVVTAEYDVFEELISADGRSALLTNPLVPVPLYEQRRDTVGNAMVVCVEAVGFWGTLRRLVGAWWRRRGIDDA